MLSDLDMRDEALEPADLSDRNMMVVDVGGGTGFTTLGIVKHVDAKNVTILDQSPHQLAKAKQKFQILDLPNCVQQIIALFLLQQQEAQ